MARLGCGMIFLGLGVWILLWALDIIPFSPRYVWVPVAVILVAVGVRLLLIDRK